MAKVKSVLNKLKKMNITVETKFENTYHSFVVGDYTFAVQGREDEDALFDQRLNGDSVLYRNPTMGLFLTYVTEAIDEQ